MVSIPTFEFWLQAIDKLEEMLDGKVKKSALFGPAEYVKIYT